MVFLGAIKCLAFYGFGAAFFLSFQAIKGQPGSLSSGPFKRLVKFSLILFLEGSKSPKVHSIGLRRTRTTHTSQFSNFFPPIESMGASILYCLESAQVQRGPSVIPMSR